MPHDVEGLAGLYENEDAFKAKLDQLFSESSEIEGEDASSDISGLIGQYAHGNEPSHHIAYLYNYVDEPLKTQALVKEILGTLYFNNPNGLSGNEDCGAMSAWYVLSSMGLYQIAPGKPEYTLGYPLFDKVTINLENGNKFVINVTNNSPENFVKTFTLNGVELARPMITHEQIENGGTLTFEKSQVIQ